MRHGRAKTARRTLRFYKLQADINPPYQILLDGNFLAALVKSKLPIKDRLEKLLQNAPFSLFVTRAALNELKAISTASAKKRAKGKNDGDQENPAEVFNQAYQWGLDECQIIENDALPPPPELSDKTKSKQEKGDKKEKECTAAQAILRLLSFATSSPPNPSKYFVASQDIDLQEKIRSSKPMVPLLHLAQGTVLLLEKPSSLSHKYANRSEQNKVMPTASMTQEEATMVQQMKDSERKRKRKEAAIASKEIKKQDYGSMDRGIAIQTRKKKKAKGPNPLSCKKKKTVDTSPSDKKKKRRKQDASADVSESTNS